MGFEYIVPLNTTQADTVNPVFYLGMWGLVALALGYVAYTRLIYSFTTLFDQQANFYWVKVADISLHAIFGFVLLLFMYIYAWSGYIGNILQNYTPNGTPPGQYGLNSTQDIYCLTLTTFGFVYLMCQFIYRYILYGKLIYDSKGHHDLYENSTDKLFARINAGDTKVELLEQTTPDKQVKFSFTLSNTAYFFRFYMLVICTLAWLVLPGAWGYAVNRDLISGGTWTVLVTTIIIAAVTGAIYFHGTVEGLESYWFPSINNLSKPDFKNSDTHAIKGYMVGQTIPFYLIMTIMFYQFTAELMIFGDQMKPVANAYVCLLIPLLMSGIAKNTATFFPFHVAVKTYYILLWYCMESIRTPLPNSSVIDKVVVDYNAGTTGPEYRFMNRYNTTFYTTGVLGFAIISLFSLYAGLFYHTRITKTITDFKYGFNTRGLTYNVVSTIET
jgi:hypothetical protein